MSDLDIELPPAWVGKLFGSIGEQWELVATGVHLRRTRTIGLALTSIRVDNAVKLDAQALEAAATLTYELLIGECERNQNHHLVRVWNHIPSILEPLGQFSQRYMVFNAGRFAAYEKTYGGRDRFPVAVATASGVGHKGSDLIVHGLATKYPARPVENPRQVPAYRYSKKFGRLPPCFSRGTLIEFDGSAHATLLVGGTASIRGENTMFEEDLEKQARETLTNLDALVAAGNSEPVDSAAVAESGLRHLHCFRHLRIYFRDTPLQEKVLHGLVRNFPRLESLEIAQADVCRPGLVIEIEGTAEIEASANRSAAGAVGLKVLGA